MKISVTDAKGKLTELVRRAEAGDEIILTRHGQATVRLVPVAKKPTGTGRRRILEEARAAGKQKAIPGAAAAGSQDFLYDDNGLPK
jgi:prevent-host-death family protein